MLSKSSGMEEVDGEKVHLQAYPALQQKGLFFNW